MIEASKMMKTACFAEESPGRSFPACAFPGLSLRSRRRACGQCLIIAARSMAPPCLQRQRFSQSLYRHHPSGFSLLVSLLRPPGMDAVPLHSCRPWLFFVPIIWKDLHAFEKFLFKSFTGAVFAESAARIKVLDLFTAGLSDFSCWVETYNFPKLAIRCRDSLLCRSRYLPLIIELIKDGPRCLFRLPPLGLDFTQNIIVW